jgi:site-specific recombinase XerD
VVAEPDSGLDRNPADKLELPMPEAPIIPVIADEDLAKLIKSMNGTTFVDRRDTAIVRVLLDTGMRRGELVGIDLDDLNLRAQEVLVHGKGGRDRIVPFSGKTALSLRKYLRARAAHGGAESPALFLSMRLGKSWRLTGGSVGEMISRRCQNVGLGHIHPHQLRHTWASDMKASGASDQQLEVLAGWAPGSIMSRRYGSALAVQQARDVARRLARGDRV